MPVVGATMVCSWLPRLTGTQGHVEGDQVRLHGLFQDYRICRFLRATKWDLTTSYKGITMNEYDVYTGTVWLKCSYPTLSSDRLCLTLSLSLLAAPLSLACRLSSPKINLVETHSSPKKGITVPKNIHPESLR